MLPEAVGKHGSDGLERGSQAITGSGVEPFLSLGAHLSCQVLSELSLDVYLSPISCLGASMDLLDRVKVVTCRSRRPLLDLDREPS